MIFLWEDEISTQLLDLYFDKDIDLNKFLFFDIETTGLALTKSNFIFLIGIGFIVNKRFFIKQFVINDEGLEKDIYEKICDEVINREFIFTYNGEKFDLPLFLNRLKMQRKDNFINEIKKRYHIDLLKITRRLWKKKIGSCSLKNVEEKVLKIEREDDLPGFMVPIYFDLYLKEKNMHYLEKILKHNRQDIISLYYLLENIIKEDLAYGKRTIQFSTN